MDPPCTATGTLGKNPDLQFLNPLDKLEELLDTQKKMLDLCSGWLKDNGFKYHGLLMGKRRGGNYHWVDNHIVRATRFEGKFTDLIEKEVSIQVFKS